MKKSKQYMKGYTEAIEDILTIVKKRKKDETTLSNKNHKVYDIEESYTNNYAIDLLEELVYNIQKKSEKFNN